MMNVQYPKGNNMNAISGGREEIDKILIQLMIFRYLTKKIWLVMN